ncbi:unnamed protein product [Spodoptera exigua]|uniref:Uncharacterized protein n=1 Tax=Spodoptera exigua TaxID=7107 RepID=A0A835LA12_SPOEX|nr:hypothetical protein HW555_002588 [Spodoptera exigua]CAH0695400.1 unnamed protein product [Spodoptera exigua]
MESGDEESTVRKRRRESEVQDEESTIRKRRRESEVQNEKSTVKKRRNESEVKDDHIAPVEKQSQTEINTAPEDSMHSDSSSEFERPVRRMERQMEFEDILKDFKDVNEPACMDRILMYLEEIKDEDYFFMELLVEKLKGETITWEQPWYQKSKSLSRPLKSEQYENDEESYRTDTICKAESDLIENNWEEFKRRYEVPDKLICLARWRNTDKSRLPNTPEEQARRYVVAFLARGLKRTIYQVFRHIVSNYGGAVKGAYSSDEEKIMKVCFTHHPNHAVTLLSMVLSREPRGIYKRLQQMFNGKPEKKRLRWSLSLATTFLKLLLKYTNLPLEELKYRKIDKDVWLKLEKKFDQHYIHLQNFWYQSLHVQVFVKETVKINKLRKHVFKSLLSSSYQVWTDIRWKDLVKQFPDGITHRFLYSVCQTVVRSIPEYLKKPLPQVAEYALEKLKNHTYRKRRLKTLELDEDGKLTITRY